MATAKARTGERKARRTQGAIGSRKTDVDKLVADRIRARRTLAGLSQAELAAKIGVAFQSVQKYENGENRVTAGRLWQIADVLDTDIAHFFHGAPRANTALHEPGSPGAPQPDMLHSQETLALLRAYYGVSSPAARQRIVELLKSLAAALRK